MKIALKRMKVSRMRVSMKLRIGKLGQSEKQAKRCLIPLAAPAISRGRFFLSDSRKRFCG
jgi:hypothetical protein